MIGLIPLPAHNYTTEQAMARLGFIRTLLREGGMDPLAARTSLDHLAQHPSEAIQRRAIELKATVTT